jgi:hypothetical protein
MLIGGHLRVRPVGVRRRGVSLAAAISSGATALVSADAGFADVPGLPYVAPDPDGMAALLNG